MTLLWLLACAPGAPPELPSTPAPRPDLPVLQSPAPLPHPDPGAALSRAECDRYVAAVFAERNFLPGQAPPPEAPRAPVGDPTHPLAHPAPTGPLGPALGDTPAPPPPPPPAAPRLAPDCSLLEPPALGAPTPPSGLTAG